VCGWCFSAHKISIEVDYEQSLFSLRTVEGIEKVCKHEFACWFVMWYAQKTPAVLICECSGPESCTHISMWQVNFRLATLGLTRTPCNKAAGNFYACSLACLFPLTMRLLVVYLRREFKRKLKNWKNLDSAWVCDQTQFLYCLICLLGGVQWWTWWAWWFKSWSLHCVTLVC